MRSNHIIRIFGLVAGLGAAAAPAWGQQTPPPKPPTPPEPPTRIEIVTAPDLPSRQAAAHRGWLGFSYMSDRHVFIAGPDRARAEEGRAVVVAQVLKGSPADKAGMEPGDTILRINGERATTERLGSTARRVKPGETVRLDVRRGGREHALTLVAAQRPSYLAPEPPFPPEMDHWETFRIDSDSIRHAMRIYLDSARFALDSLHLRLPRTVMRSDSMIIMQFDAGRRADTIRLPRMDSLRMHLRHLQDSIRVNLPHVRVWQGDELDGLPGFDVEVIGRRAIAGAALQELNSQLASYFGVREGILVENVAPGTPAGKAGLQAGDVITAAGGRPVGNIADLRRAVSGRQGAVKLDLVRKAKKQQVELKWP